MPFVRFERVDTQGKPPAGFFHNPKNRRDFYAVGINLKPIPQLVIKALGEEQRTLAPETSPQRTLYLSLGYAF